jgi:hypothetical protein
MQEEYRLCARSCTALRLHENSTDRVGKGEKTMKRLYVPLPEIGLIAVTRAALGAGIGLLIADHLTRQQRQMIGRTLLGIGVLTTIPLVADVLRRQTSCHSPRAGYDEPTLASLVHS